MIKVEIVADSLAPSNVRLTTFVLTYPRFIHAEFMTHRMFSRNASSSRAIPVSKSIEMVKKDPVIPLAFTRNQRGMQGGEALDKEAHDKALAAWLEGRDRAVEIAERLSDLEVHKQYANRIIEPFANITVVVTATDWDNFFALRCHPAAQPEIHALADLMYEVYMSSSPNKLDAGQLHLPFVGESDSHYSEKEKLVMSVARCARVSYLNHDGTSPDYFKDLALYNRLVGSAPIHASPAEHQAMAIGDPNARSGNFRGWVQFRQTLSNQNILKYEPSENK